VLGSKRKKRSGRPAKCSGPSEKCSGRPAKCSGPHKKRSGSPTKHSGEGTLQAFQKYENHLKQLGQNNIQV